MGKKLIGSGFLTGTAHTGFDLTTKGDMHGYTTTQARIPVGTNNYSVLADSAQALGLKWAVSPTSVMSGAQDILYSSSANTLARLGAGTDGDLLTTHGTGSAPTWETPTGGGAISFLEEFTLGASATSWTSTLSSAYVLADFECLICEAVLKKITNAASTQFQWNGDTSSYFHQAVQVATGTVSGISETGASAVTVEDNAGVPNTITITIRFYENPEDTARHKCFYQTSCDTDVCRYGTFYRTNAGTDISELKFLSADANIEAGAIMRLYTMAKS